MKIAVLILTLGCAAAFAERRGGIVPRRSAPVMSHQAPSPSGTVTHLQQVPVSRPNPVVNQSHFIRDGRGVRFPRHDADGHDLNASAARFPPAHHAGIVRNPAVIRDIREHERFERASGRYYWHHAGGVRYSHYYDRFGVHWYGFYVGPSFYWTRWWGDRWWWYDPNYARWVYWHDNYWWWQGPDGLVYVYVDNNYYPYDQVVGGVTTAEPRPKTPAQAAPPTVNAGKAYYSPDGRRMIQLFGDRGEAFLYDLTGDQPKFMVYLGANVSTVRFTGGTRGKALQVLLDFKDGTFALFDDEGRSLSGTPQAEKPVQAPPEPPVRQQAIPSTGDADQPSPESPAQPPPTPQPGEIPGNPPPEEQ